MNEIARILNPHGGSFFWLTPNCIEHPIYRRNSCGKMQSAAHPLPEAFEKLKCDSDGIKILDRKEWTPFEMFHEKYIIHNATAAVVPFVAVFSAANERPTPKALEWGGDNSLKEVRSLVSGLGDPKSISKLSKVGQGNGYLGDILTEEQCDTLIKIAETYSAASNQKLDFMGLNIR